MVKTIYGLFFLWLASSQACAQVETGQIAGIVTQTGGTALAAASLKLTSVSSGMVRIATASGAAYSIPLLPPGNYTLEASAPGLAPESRRVMVAAGSRLRQDFSLALQPSSMTQGVEGENSGSIDTQTQTLRRSFTEAEIRRLPTLTRNPYEFTELAGNVSDAGLGTRGAGFVINGQRESSTYVLLDGAGNMNEFSGATGQQIPLDAVQEITVLTGDFTAEYGRAAGGIVNAVSKSGGDRLHGTAYEFNRTAHLTSNSYKDNANGVPRAAFMRNQFGYSLGAPIRRNKLFVFNSTEALLVRSDATNLAWVPAPQLLARTAANTQAFFQSLGQLRSQARQIGAVTLDDLTAIYGRNPCTGLPCATLPRDLPLLSHVAWSAPADAGGGAPQDTWNTFTRLDYNLSERTWIYARYALYRERNPAGVLATSPYENYDLGQRYFDNSFLASLTHSWSARRISQTSLAFNRLNIFQQGLTSRGVVPSMYANPLAPVAIGSDSLAFPGYSPFAPGGSGAFGGPQNVLEINHDTSWVKGKHTLRFGGSWRYIRDNRTSAAFQTAVDSLSNGGGVGPAVNGLLSGRFAHIQVAINPVTSGGVITSPDFSRSNRFGDRALYLQDYWSAAPHFSINAGLRWDQYGVQHNKNPNLDSNWYAPGIGFADDDLGAYLRRGMLQQAPRSSIGKLWKPEWKDFAPRVGFAWDIFGNGRTSLRGGYGTGYERNFGNVTFNVIRNLPNYAVIDVAGPVTTSNFGALSSGGAIALPRAGARIIDPQIKTAYAHFWGASIQREIARGLVYSIEYSGSKGVHLYSVSYPNQAGFGNAVLSDPCAGNGDCRSQPNPNYSEDVGYRGNQGFSIYHGLNNQITMNDFLHRGISLTTNYTWSHAIDNLSSTFFEAGGQGVAGQYGGQNVTINNGNFQRGLLDPYHPELDRGDAEFDVRHRVTLSGNWRLPSWNKSGWTGMLLRGWSLNPIFAARSGQPFSVFDTSAQTLDLNTPRATFVKPVPRRRNTFVPSTTPDTFHILTFLPAQIASEPNPLTPGSRFPVNMSRRNAFRAPGFLNVNLGVLKDTRLTDRLTLQIRGEAFNLLNHANLYVIGATADTGSGNTVDACFGCTGSPWDRRQVQVAARLLF